MWLHTVRPYTVGMELLNMLDKIARHAHDRIKERTSLKPWVVNYLERKVNKKYPRGLHGQHYLPIRRGGQVRGFGIFRKFQDPKTKDHKMIMVTVYGSDMKPKGTQLPKHLGSVSTKAE